ncbi:hypothetical protein [Yersinia sp. 2466 StPb PI]|uniref:hypothetical protein n=1 Tax=Yersinia sp. 2466 StPb PI TaxID=3061648 RepID=UPI00355C9CEA
MTKKLDALSQWLNHQSWISGHHQDEARFYRAVFQILKENGENSISPEDVRDYVINQFSGMLENEFLEVRADEAAERFEIISDFCATNGL